MPVFYRDLGLALDEIGILIAVQARITLVAIIVAAIVRSAPGAVSPAVSSPG